MKKILILFIILFSCKNEDIIEDEYENIMNKLTKPTTNKNDANNKNEISKQNEEMQTLPPP